MSKRLIVEITTDGKWESGYRLKRSSMDKVYKYMDLLLMEEGEEIDVSDITNAIDSEYEKAGL